MITFVQLVTGVGAVRRVLDLPTMTGQLRINAIASFSTQTYLVPGAIQVYQSRDDVAKTSLDAATVAVGTPPVASLDGGLADMRVVQGIVIMPLYVGVASSQNGVLTFMIDWEEIKLSDLDAAKMSMAIYPV